MPSMGKARSRLGGRAGAGQLETSRRLACWGQAAVCLALTSATALACGGSTNSDNDNDSAAGDTSSATSAGTATPGAIASLDDLLRELVVITCRNDCSEAALFETFFGAECLEIYPLVYETLGASVQRSLDAGTTSFDAAAAKRCVDELAASECGATLSAPACDEVFVGQVPIGGACTESDECAGSAYCEDTLMCPGTCAASLDAGADCASGGECETGLVCTAAGVCGAVKATGETCNSGVECQTRYCHYTASEGRCAEAPRQFVKALGEPCESALECAVGLYCPESTAGARSCVAAVGAGEPCQLLSVGSTCVREAYCAIESTDTEGVCVERIPLGGACTLSEACVTGICDGGACVKHSGLGEPCVTSERCFGVCEAGACALPPVCPAE